MSWGAPKIGTVATVASGNITLAEPAGIASGELMIACIGYRSNAAFTVPGDWNLVATQQSSGDTDATNGIASGVMMWCVRGGSAPTLTFNRTAGDVAQGQIIAYAGGHASAPYDTGASATAAAATTQPLVSTFNTTENGELIVAMCSLGDAISTTSFDATGVGLDNVSSGTDTTDAPSAGQWRMRANTTTGTGADHGLSIGDAILATAGGTGSVFANVATAARHVMIVGAFKLAASGPPSTFTADDTAIASETTARDGTVSQADTATGTDTQSASGTVSIADTATSTDTPTTVYSSSVSDTATASESLASSGAETIADTGTATDAQSATTAASQADTASATDSPTQMGTVASTDTATATDEQSQAGTTSLSDTGTASETLTDAGTFALADTSTATDTFSYTEDSAEDTSTVTDTATATDSPTFDAQASVVDTATATENLFASITITITDAATATDVFSIGSDTSTASDTASATDAPSFVAEIVVADAASAQDEFLGHVEFLFTDTAAAIDIPSHVEGIPATSQEPYYVTLSPGLGRLTLNQGEQHITVSRGVNYLTIGEPDG